jgi:HSP20 family protein
MATALATRTPRTMRSWDPFQTVREEVENLWSSLASERGESWFAPVGVPPIDLFENETTVKVRMDIPGIKPEDFDIQMNNNMLTVSGQRQEEKEEKGQTFHRVERRSGGFSRSITLPAAVSEDKVDAQYKEGVLTITMPKTEEAKSRRIKVKG